MSAEENKELVRRFSGVWRDRNFYVLDELLSPDFVAHHSDGTEILGAAGWKQFVMDAYSESSEIDTAGGPLELVADGDPVAELWSWRSVDSATGRSYVGTESQCTESPTAACRKTGQCLKRTQAHSMGSCLY